MNCYICDHTSHSFISGKVRDLPDVDILQCDECGLVFLENFSHIHSNFYKDSGMYNGDIDLPQVQLRESRNDDTRRFQHVKDLICNKRVLDFGCAYGGFLDMAKTTASSCEGVEVNQRAQDVLNAKGIITYADVDKIPDKNKYDIITLFHVLEHLPDPRNILHKLAYHLEADGHMIIEVPNSKDALTEIYKSKEFSEFTYWSCHLMLYNADNLNLLFKQCGLRVDYIQQVQRYPLSNHLYWMMKGRPGGHKVLNFLNSETLHAEYEKQLSSIGCCDTIIAKVRREY